jgi:hypothetical protein
MTYGISRLGLTSRRSAKVALPNYTNAYKGEIPPVGVKTDFYAVTFSYRLKADFPGLPKCNTVFKGKAKAFLDPDTGVWEAKVELDDGGGNEYLKLLAAQKERGP